MELNSERLTIRLLRSADAAFIVELLNTEGFIQNIGDRQVRTLTQAEDKIAQAYSAEYPSHGLFAVELKASGQVIGTVSYLKRAYLEYDDIGYAFLPEFWGKGYATEATKLMLDHKLALGIKQIWGVVNSDNKASIKLLERLGFHTTGMVLMEGEDEPILQMEFHAT